MILKWETDFTLLPKMYFLLYMRYKSKIIKNIWRKY